MADEEQQLRLLVDIRFRHFFWSMLPRRGYCRLGAPSQRSPTRISMPTLNDNQNSSQSESDWYGFLVVIVIWHGDVRPPRTAQSTPTGPTPTGRRQLYVHRKLRPRRERFSVAARSAETGARSPQDTEGQGSREEYYKVFAQSVCTGKGQRWCCLSLLQTGSGC